MQFKERVCLPSLLNGERGRRSCGGLGLHRSKGTIIGIDLRSKARKKGWTKGLDYYLVVYISRSNILCTFTQLVLDGVVDEVW